MSSPAVQRWVAANATAHTKQLMVPFRAGGSFEMELLVGQAKLIANFERGQQVQLLTVEREATGEYEAVFLYSAESGWRALLRFGVEAADVVFDINSALEELGQPEPEMVYDVVEGGKYA